MHLSSQDNTIAPPNAYCVLPDRLILSRSMKRFLGISSFQILAMTLIHFGRNAVAIIIPQYLSLGTGLALPALTLSHVLNLRSAGLILSGFFAGRLCRAIGERKALVIASSYGMASSYIPPEKRGTCFALFNATLFLSWGVGATLIAGPVTDGFVALGVSESHAYMASFMGCAAVTLAGILVLFRLFRVEKNIGSWEG